MFLIEANALPWWQKINPGFGYFDKPWLLGLFVGSLTLSGFIGLYLAFQLDCNELCTKEGQIVERTMRQSEVLEMYHQIITPACESSRETNGCTFTSFKADVCIMYGRAPYTFVDPKEKYYSELPVTMREIRENICAIAPDDHILSVSKWNAARKGTHMNNRHPSRPQGTIDVPGMHWCEGAWEQEVQNTNNYEAVARDVLSEPVT